MRRVAPDEMEQSEAASRTARVAEGARGVSEQQLNLFEQEPELPVAKLEAIVRDMERERPTGPRPEPCRCEKSLLFADEYGEVSCSRCGREPRR